MNLILDNHSKASIFISLALIITVVVAFTPALSPYARRIYTIGTMLNLIGCFYYVKYKSLPTYYAVLGAFGYLGVILIYLIPRGKIVDQQTVAEVETSK